MRLIKLFLLSVLIFGTLIFLISLAFPSRAVVERSGVIDAPIAEVYAQVNNLKTWPSWNPWSAPGVVQKTMYGGQTEGKGASYSWTGESGNNPISGSVTITESDPQKGISYNMAFSSMKPMTGAFDLRPSADGKGTAIRWRLETKLGLLPWWKLRGFLADKLTGPQLEDGLTKLKNICEKK